MNIGDRVRVIHGNEEGFITKLIDNQLVEIEIEAGFTMPVLRSEVVLINKEEKDHFSKDEYTKETIAPLIDIPSAKGLFLAFIESESVLLDVYLINNTDLELLCTLSSIDNDLQKGTFSGIIADKSFSIVGKWNIQDFDNWGSFQFQAIQFSTQPHHPTAPITKQIKFKAKSFHNSKGDAPLIGKPGYLLSLD